MSGDTIVYYNLARMYEYVKDIMKICEDYQNDYMRITSEMLPRHAVNMCLVQLGEHAARIRDANIEMYKSSSLQLSGIKGVRDRIAHSYGRIDYSLIRTVLQDDIPKLKDGIEGMVAREVLDDPYILYETEYADLMKEKEEK